MEITILTVGPVATNCYIVNKEGSRSCVVIDPGEEAGKIASYIEKKGLNNEGILLTHGHFDHITGVSELVSLVGGKVYAYEGEKELMMDPRQNGSVMMGYELAIEPENLLRDGEILSVAGMAFKVIHTPGHTIGGCCYYLQEEKVLFSGDTLFRESIGRTDFPTGNGGQLMRSIREKLFTLPEETAVYPGHMERTTIGDEKKYNPYF